MRKQTPEEAEIRAAFRKTRDKLKKQIRDYEDSELKLDEVSGAIKIEYSVVARLEEELTKVPTDEELLEELEGLEANYNPDTKKATIEIPEFTYNRLLNKLARLEAKVGRVNLLNDIGKHSRFLTQNITAAAQINELQANTKRIELTAHNATLLALSKMFYLSMRKIGLTDKEIVGVAKQMKKIQKDYPLVETDFTRMRKLLFAEPEEVPTVIEDADFEEIDDTLASVNALVTKRTRRSRK